MTPQPAPAASPVIILLLRVGPRLLTVCHGLSQVGSDEEARGLEDALAVGVGVRGRALRVHVAHLDALQTCSSTALSAPPSRPQPSSTVVGGGPSLPPYLWPCRTRSWPGSSPPGWPPSLTHTDRQTDRQKRWGRTDTVNQQTCEPHTVYPFLARLPACLPISSCLPPRLTDSARLTHARPLPHLP